MAITLALPHEDGTLERYRMRDDAEPLPTHAAPARTRVAYAAAHVVADPLAPGSPVTSPAVDWDATLAYRHHLWDLGLGVAEAMDTAQRGTGLPPELVPELIRRSVRAARERGAAIACAAATDSLPPGPAALEAISSAYRAQCDMIEDAGGRVVLMASRQLAAAATGAADYEHVYGRVLRGLARPAILHWLGPAFDPALAGYWGSADVPEAAKVVTRIVEDNLDRVDGIKVSLLDADAEVALRRAVPSSVRVYTGDDFSYPALIRGDGVRHSDALLGVFDAIAPLAAVALQSLDEGDPDHFEAVLAPTVPLARKLFEAPTYHYKTGIVFLAFLRGFQPHFRMVAGMESARSAVHLAGVFRLADQAGLFADPELAAHRMRGVMALAGVAGRP
jgi:Protein of unknown function (DUF993)